MPPRDTFGRSDKGPTKSTRTSAQIKKRSSLITRRKKKSKKRSRK